MNSFVRNEELLDPKVVATIYQSSVMIVGLGGVGSFACEAIARLGFKQLILIDPDVYEASNINRQLGALTTSLGQKKIAIMRQRVLDINPRASVITLAGRYDETTFTSLKAYNIDYVIDAIDSLTDKWQLIKDCLQHNIPFVSSGGMANKDTSDHIQVVPLSKTTYDPVSKVLRAYARKEGYDLNKIPICIQTQPYPKKEVSFSLSSLIFAPAVSGLRCAEYILHLIQEKK